MSVNCRCPSVVRVSRFSLQSCWLGLLHLRTRLKMAAILSQIYFYDVGMFSDEPDWTVRLVWFCKWQILEILLLGFVRNRPKIRTRKVRATLENINQRSSDAHFEPLNHAHCSTRRRYPSGRIQLNLYDPSPI